MTDSRKQRAKGIHAIIGETLMQHWDPIGVAQFPEAGGEYDSYIGLIYRIISGSKSEDELIKCLAQIEEKEMGLKPSPREHLQVVASRLLALDVRLPKQE